MKFLVVQVMVFKLKVTAAEYLILVLVQVLSRVLFKVEAALNAF